MKNELLPNEEAIRRIVSRTRPDKPSEGFTSRIMDRLMLQPEPVSKITLIYQYGILAVAAGIAVMMLIFPAWTMFDFDMKLAGASAAQMAGYLTTNALTTLGQLVGKIGALGKYAYFIPVSIAILLVSVFDQVISRKSQTNSVK
jgi:hypothetical protein